MVWQSIDEQMQQLITGDMNWWNGSNPTKAGKLRWTSKSAETFMARVWSTRLRRRRLRSILAGQKVSLGKAKKEQRSMVEALDSHGSNAKTIRRLQG